MNSNGVMALTKYQFPNLSKGFRFLTDETVQEVYSGALEALGRAGVMFDNFNALKILETHGVNVDFRRKMAWFPESLVKESVLKVPEEVILYDTMGREALTLSDYNVYFNPGSTAINILDFETGVARKPTTWDLANFTRLVDALENIHAQSTALVVSDVPNAIVDRYRLYVVLKNSRKPVVTGAFTTDGVKDMKTMIEAVVGEDYARKPPAIFDICPSPPLMWSQITAQNLIDCVEEGLPIELVSMPVAGGSAPVTLAGSLVQHTAENLSGLVLAQLIKPGAPIIYGGSPSILDMRYGSAVMGAVETVMMCCAYVEIGKYLGLPTHAYLGLSDSKLLDAQAGLESGLGLALGALAGVNVISGPGMLEFESCQSFEKLVVDNEICGMALRLKQGIEASSEKIATDLIVKLGAGGQFLQAEHTREWFRKEHYMPSMVINRMGRAKWVAEGAKDAGSTAKEVVQRLLAEHKPNPLPSEADKRLDRVVKRILKTHGVVKKPHSAPQ